jgi:hypothetical protein
MYIYELIEKYFVKTKGPTTFSTAPQRRSQLEVKEQHCHLIPHSHL